MRELYYRRMDSLRLVPLLMLAAAVTANADSGVEIPIDVTALSSEPPREMRALIREASALWQPAGVKLTWIESAAARALPRRAPVLEVVCEDGGPPGAAKDQLRLGSTTFRDRSGVAEPTLRLSVNSVKRLVDRTRWTGRLVDDWPSAIRHELVGRALGRVLAHEIGHFLLAWRRHTPHGLMRAEFGSIELLEHDRRLFVLPADLLPRLQTHLEQLTGRTKTLLAVE